MSPLPALRRSLSATVAYTLACVGVEARLEDSKSMVMRMARIKASSWL